MSLLEINDLSVDYRVGDHHVRAVDHVTLSLERGESLGIAGESGCGKTSIGLAVPLLLPANATLPTGSITLNGQSLVGKSEEEMNQIRWSSVAFVFQGAMNALNPVLRIDRQIREAISRHEPNVSKEEANARVLEMFDLVGVSASRARSYPHEFSGGMRQRAMIAMSLVCRPLLLIADEPTTALDVISQAQILALLNRLRRDQGLSLIMISHDLAAIKRVCDRVIVMYAGVVVEMGPASEVLGKGSRRAQPAHPYTKALISAHPDLRRERVLSEGLSGHPPDLATTIVGCRFADRCPSVMSVCRTTVPETIEVSPGHVAACHLLTKVRT